MLGQRIVTAVILLAVLAAAMMSANPWWFVALLALAAACANWEWLRLTLPQPPSPLISVGVAALLFAGMLGLAALNRYRLTPALAQAIEEEDAPRAQALLRASLVVEGGLAIVILGLVAWLGTLSPPMSM